MSRTVPADLLNVAMWEAIANNPPSFVDQPGYRRHLRNSHPGAVNNPDHRNTSAVKSSQGQRVLKWLVLSHRWQFTHYVCEPRLSPRSLVHIYANAL